MVTITSFGGKPMTGILEIVGTSSDIKPVESYNDCRIMNGSTFLEMDTGVVYFYDEEAQQWIII